MIHLTRINRTPLILNCDLIEQIETTPDTVITLTSGRNYMVLESAEEVIRRSIDYRQQVLRGPRVGFAKQGLQPIEEVGHGC